MNSISISEIPNMTDQEFDSKMIEIFDIEDNGVVLRELWDLYNGSMAGCKQWLDYRLLIETHLVSERESLAMWNDATVDSVKSLEYDIHEVVIIERKSGVLVEKKLYYYTGDDKVLYEQFS